MFFLFFVCVCVLPRPPPPSPPTLVQRGSPVEGETTRPGVPYMEEKVRPVVLKNILFEFPNLFCSSEGIMISHP